jgi:hypothetical protein
MKSSALYHRAAHRAGSCCCYSIRPVNAGAVAISGYIMSWKKPDPTARQTFIFGAFAMMNVQDCPRMHCCGSLIYVYLHLVCESGKKPSTLQNIKDQLPHDLDLWLSGTYCTMFFVYMVAYSTVSI